MLRRPPHPGHDQRARGILRRRKGDGATSPRLREYQGKLTSSATLLADALDTRYAFDKELSRLYVYAGMLADQDTRDPVHEGMRQEMVQLASALASAGAFIEPELLRADRATIGRFQGVKHPLAEAYVDIESCKSLVYYAAWALDHQAADAALAVSRAKAYASDALPRFGIDTVQLHGAIGYTAEYDAQLYLKRAKWVRAMYGDADWHYERVARLGGV